MQFGTFEKLRALEAPVLVTGHTGFKGTWLIALLKSLGIQTAGIALPPDENSIYTKANYLPEIEFLIDIRDRNLVLDTIKKIEPQVIIHMAAQPLVIDSYKRPLETFETNVMGTAHILDACIQVNSVQVAAVITTDKVYRNLEHVSGFIESDPLAGKDPYSASKVGSEAAVSAWTQISEQMQGPRITSFRAGNVIGGGDFAENRLLPDYIRAQIYETDLEIRNPNSTRPWQHVLDPLLGYLLGVEAQLTGENFKAMNFGPLEESLSVREVIRIADKKWPLQAGKVIYADAGSTLEAQNLNLNSNLAKSLLNWVPNWTQEDSVDATLEWWRSVLSGEKSYKEAMDLDIQKILGNLVE